MRDVGQPSEEANREADVLRAPPTPGLLLRLEGRRREGGDGEEGERPRPHRKVNQPRDVTRPRRGTPQGSIQYQWGKHMALSYGCNFPPFSLHQLLHCSPDALKCKACCSLAKQDCELHKTPEEKRSVPRKVA